MTDERLKIINDILKQFSQVFDAHSGGAEVVALEPEAVILRLIGHCNGCSLAPLTFGLGIEKLIKEQIPSIKEIRYTK
jgi:Fe-S cluster biogenesis protein NfuA